jgi:hypothetical protein
MPGDGREPQALTFKEFGEERLGFFELSHDNNDGEIWLS